MKCDKCGGEFELPVLNAYKLDKKFCPYCGAEFIKK